jgi:hypothetical protein
MLEKLEGTTQVPIQFNLDDDGYFDRRCPQEGCRSEFKVFFEHYRDKGSDDGTYCAFCGFKSAPPTFNTPEQEEHIRATVLAAAAKIFQEGLRSAATEFNRKQRQQRNSFISMRMEVRSSSHPPSLPPNAAEAMRRDCACTSCGSRYRTLGAGFFCPTCGQNSAADTFDQALARVREVIAIFRGLTSQMDRDAEAVLRIQLVEGGLADVVTAFQRWAELSFARLPSPGAKLRRNVFQNLVEGSAAWQSAGGTPYSAILDQDELGRLARYFQQRHILEHRDGFVDEDYLRLSGDTSYTTGQRLVVREDAVLDLVGLAERLVGGMRRDLIPMDRGP